MALAMNIDKASGVRFFAYLRATVRASDFVTIDAEEGRRRGATVQIEAFGSEHARRAGHPIEKFWTEAAPDELASTLLGSGSRDEKLTAAYAWLKTLPAYADAVDC